MTAQASLVPSFSAGESRRRQWTVALVALVWAQGIVPSAIRSFTTSKRQLSLTTGGTAPTTALVARADQMLTYGEMLCSLLILVIFGRDARLHGGGRLGLALLPWIYLVARDAYNGDLVDRRQLVYPLVVLAVWALGPSLRDLRVLGYLVAATAVLSLAMGWFFPRSGILQGADTAAAAVEDKQIFSQGILVGPFNQGNQLGLYLAVGIVSLACIESRRLRWLLIAMCGYALLWSSARSSLATCGLLAGVVLLFNASSRRARIAVAVPLIAAVGAFVCITPILTHDPEAFTNRGFIWTQVLKAWGEQPSFGLGTDWFARTAATSDAFASSGYDAHNQFLQLLTTGGIVLVGLVGLLLGASALSAVRCARRGETFGLYFMIALLGAGWLEATFGFVDRNQMMATAILPIVFLLFADRTADVAMPSAVDAERSDPDCAACVSPAGAAG